MCRFLQVHLLLRAGQRLTKVKEADALLGDAENLVSSLFRCPTRFIMTSRMHFYFRWSTQGAEKWSSDNPGDLLLQLNYLDLVFLANSIVVTHSSMSSQTSPSSMSVAHASRFTPNPAPAFIPHSQAQLRRLDMEARSIPSGESEVLVRRVTEYRLDLKKLREKLATAKASVPSGGARMELVRGTWAALVAEGDWIKWLGRRGKLGRWLW